MAPPANTRKNNKCPKGYILRKGYTRKFKITVKQLGYTVRRGSHVFTVRPKKNSIHVPATCIKDRGLPGKGPREGQGSFAKLRKGELLKFGYSYRLSDSTRRVALKRAIEHYGALGVFRKLDAVAKLSARTAPDASHIFAIDRDWVRRNYPLKQ
jgi:hypothetical protein